MKDGIDYMQAEMDKAVEQYGVNRQFSEFYLGWRAACEAAHARAEAKGGAEQAELEDAIGLFVRAEYERRQFQRAEDSEERWSWRQTLEVTLTALRAIPSVAEAMKKYVIPVTTEAEARRVAGFAEETQ